MNYPHAPGFQGTDTSRSAARHASASMRMIHNQVMERLRHSSGLTSDEVAEQMQMSVLAVRPRMTELKLLGLIKDSGQRRANNLSGKRAIVYKANHDVLQPLPKPRPPDAKLIAAAPKLLEALAAAYDYAPCFQQMNAGLREQVAAAIADALGDARQKNATLSHEEGEKE